MIHNDNVIYHTLNHKGDVSFDKQCHDFVEKVLYYTNTNTNTVTHNKQIKIVGYSCGCNVVLKSTSLLMNFFDYKTTDLKIVLINPSNFFSDVYYDTDKYFTGSLNTIHNKSLLEAKSLEKNKSKYSSTYFLLKAKFLYHVCKFIPYIKTLLIWFYIATDCKKLDEPPELINFSINCNPYDIIKFIHSNLATPNIYRLIDMLPTTIKRIKIISGKNDRYNNFAKLLSEYRNDLFTLCEVNGKHHLFHRKDFILDNYA